MTRRLDLELAAKAADALPADRIGKDLRTVLRSLPVMIRSHGLIASGAYLLSRADGDEGNRYRVAARAILADATASAGIRTRDGRGDALALLDALTASGSDQRYRLAEARARQFAIWLARLAEARFQAEEKARQEESAPRRVDAGGDAP
ncbi:type III-B CRISPR module-associated protein Cmr5 [Gandjariella thermophila]|uniref:CRISPR type III-B/RAMP module-associated protein Cmr5 n=1 Tax=Gandjariella thermophila TaxID=1931992 RepID=A0A4D4J533_9PSEU|nr:type III-B CRISPR module-associated protein Cmr5 [Gandjariella thermophila]GDY29087.1 hypothetical protein GTS_07200 [Gandjariella thermophila]